MLKYTLKCFGETAQKKVCKIIVEIKVNVQKLGGLKFNVRK